MKKFLHNFAAISITAKRNLLSLVFILVSLSASGQNGIIGTGFTNGWSNADIISFTGSAGSSRISTLKPRETGSSNRFFRLVRNWNNNLTQFGPFNCVDTDWTNPGVTYGMSVCGNRAFFINCPNTTDNYVFKTPNGDTATTLLYFRVQGDVRTISSVTQFPVAANVAPCSGTTVTANLSGALSAGQAVYLRYTKDAYATSTVIPLTGSGTTYTGTIPLAFNTLNANVSYYVFTSGTTTPSGADADLYTINLNNNSGANYTYTVTTATTSTWNGTAWSTCSPTSSIDAIIDGTYGTTANGVFTAKSLTVNAPLTVNSTTSITVENALVNNSTITVENNANLIQTSLTATNSGSGTATVTRNSNALKRLDYTMWSSPVTAQNLLAFSPLTSAVSPIRFYLYNPLSDLYVTVNPQENSFLIGRGYLIRMPNEKPGSLGLSTPYYLGTETLAYPGVFTGTLNNGPIDLTPLTANNYISVGNPYPSTIDADAFLSGNETDGVLYFWRKTNGTGGTAYSSYTLAGGVAGASGIIPNGTIQVGQGFIVKATSTTLSFTNAMREIAPTSTQFLKTKKADKSRLWLDLSDATGRMNQVLIGYLASATLGVDAGIDGKYFNDSKIALTSIINGEEYVIQGRPTFDATDVVALGFKTDVAGAYTIALNSFDGLFAAGQDIYLVDAVAGKEIDLKTGSYSFTATAAVDNTRFSLKYQKTLSIEGQEISDNSVIVYKNSGVIYVNSGAKMMNNIKVFDIQGRLITEQKSVKANTTSIQNLKASNQVLIVNVTTDDNQVISKKVEN
jgi:hypothetical protein